MLVGNIRLNSLVNHSIGFYSDFMDIYSHTNMINIGIFIALILEIILY